MPKKDQKILIATGGTGGHVFPSISLIDFIKQEYHIEVTTDKRGLKFLKNLENTRINIIDTNTIFEKNFFKFLTRILILTFSFFKSIFLVIKLKPKLVFNALHGKYGEDGFIQSILEMLKLPFFF